MDKNIKNDEEMEKRIKDLDKKADKKPKDDYVSIVEKLKVQDEVTKDLDKKVKDLIKDDTKKDKDTKKD